MSSIRVGRGAPNNRSLAARGWFRSDGGAVRYSAAFAVSDGEGDEGSSLLGGREFSWD